MQTSKGQSMDAKGLPANDGWFCSLDGEGCIERMRIVYGSDLDFRSLLGLIRASRRQEELGVRGISDLGFAVTASYAEKRD